MDHATGAASGDAVTDYTHPSANTGLPHAVEQATVKGGAHDGQTSAFSYDKAGNTTRRTIGSRTQDLTWDQEGHLATLTESGKTTSYAYDADGDRMIAKNADGSSTLSLPDGSELKVDANGAKTGTRYYTHNGETVAVRTGSDISYVFNDRQGTAMTAVAVGSLVVTRRKQLPFGESRTEAAFPGNRGFVGGTKDPTGLTHLGAREYDPTLGRFLSVDPVIDVDDPAQMNAYSYAHNSPVTKSDPDGLRPDGPAGGANADTWWGLDRGMTVGYTQESGRWVWHQTPLKDQGSRQRYAAYRSNPGHYMIDDSYAAAAKRRIAEARAQAIKRAKAAEAQRRKKDGIFGSLMKGHFSDAWKNTTDKVTDKHWLIDKGVGVLAAAGTGLCIAVEPCGAGVLIVGAAGLYAGGLGAHYFASSRAERREGMSKYMLGTAKVEATGMLSGRLCGRGLGGCMVMGSKEGFPLEGVSRTQIGRVAAQKIGRAVKDFMF